MVGPEVWFLVKLNIGRYLKKPETFFSFWEMPILRLVEYISGFLFSVV